MGTVLQSIFSSVTGKILGMKKPILSIVIGYLITVLVATLTFYVAWLLDYLGIIHVNEQLLMILLQFIDRLVGPYMVAFVTFIAGCFVDLNGDGIPDRLESIKPDSKPINMNKE